MFSFPAREEQDGSDLVKDRRLRPMIHLLIKTALEKLKARVSLLSDKSLLGIIFFSGNFHWNLVTNVWETQSTLLVEFHIATLAGGAL